MPNIARPSTVVSSGGLDRCWTYHLDREHHRTHQAHNQDKYTLTA
jgi:hypothetical protein